MFVEKFLNKDLRCDSCHLNLPGRRFLWQQRKIFLAETPFTVDGTHNIIVNDDFPPMKAEVYVHVSVCLHERAVFQTLPLCGNQPRTTCSEMPAFTVRTKRLTTNAASPVFCNRRRRRQRTATLLPLLYPGKRTGLRSGVTSNTSPKRFCSKTATCPLPAGSRLRLLTGLIRQHFIPSLVSARDFLIGGRRREGPEPDDELHPNSLGGKISRAANKGCRFG